MNSKVIFLKTFKDAHDRFTQSYTLLHISFTLPIVVGNDYSFWPLLECCILYIYISNLFIIMLDFVVISCLICVI